MAADSLIDPAMFNSFAACAAILALKLLTVAMWTSKVRMVKRVFANPEDALLEKSKIKLNDVDIERIRRAHMNAIENIPAFFAVALVYMLTGPSVFIAIWHFRIFTVSRILHSLCYINEHKFRGMAYMGGLLVTISMAVQVLLSVGLSAF